MKCEPARTSLKNHAFQEYYRNYSLGFFDIREMAEMEILHGLF